MEFDFEFNFDFDSPATTTTTKLNSSVQHSGEHQMVCHSANASNITWNFQMRGAFVFFHRRFTIDMCRMSIRFKILLMALSCYKWRLWNFVSFLPVHIVRTSSDIGNIIRATTHVCEFAHCNQYYYSECYRNYWFEINATKIIGICINAFDANETPGLKTITFTNRDA